MRRAVDDVHLAAVHRDKAQQLIKAERQEPQ
jgi:hypothetical protein